MTLLDSLLDARRVDVRPPLPAPVAESFVESKIKRVPRGVPGAGRFADKPGGARGGMLKSRIPEGSGPAIPEAKDPAARRARTRSNIPAPMRDRKSFRTGKVYGSTPGEKPSPANRRKLTEEELPKAVGTGPWSRPAAAMAVKLKAGEVEDTEQGHRQRLKDGSLGQYTPERIELHARIARALLQGADTHEKPQALFMAGGPASGKSSLLKAGAVSYPGDSVDVNPDIVKAMLPEYDALVKAGDKAASSKVHEESSHIAKMVMNLAIERKHHVIVDGVGNSGPGKFAGKIRQAMDAGLDVSVVYATIDTDEAVARAAKRGERTGRNVPEGYLRSSHAAVSEMFLRDVMHLPVKVAVYETATKKPKKAWSKTPTTSGQIADRRAYEAFVKKARSTS